MQNNTFPTLFIAQNLIRLSAVDSTNNFLKLMVSKSEPLQEGTVIMADDQYAGRGQQGNQWVSKAGLNLTFSIYLRPVFLSVEDQFLLNIAVCTGIRNALRLVVTDGFKIKWPNDIYFKDKKIGGVLIENSLFGSTIKSSIIGIGINVNQVGFKEMNLDSASSLREILHEDVDLTGLLGKICKGVEVEYLKLKSGGGAKQRLDYVQGLYKYGVDSNFKHNQKVFTGRIVDVTNAGLLIIDEGGVEKQYSFKEIEFLSKK